MFASATLFAISLLHPKMAENTAKLYAEAIDKQAIVAGVDTLAFVGIIEFESQFRADAVSDDLEDRGLMQIRARYYKGKPEWLFNPVVNIAAGAAIVKESVRLCEKKLGRTPMLSEYYSLYSGAGNKSYCKPTKLSTQLEVFRDCLFNAVFNYTDIKECKDVYAKSHTQAHN